MTNNTGNRLISLDVFRGITIASMILVNTPGSWSYVYAPLKHAPWHGLTPTDLVFPFFLFAVGVAMSFSLKKYTSPGAAITKITKRTILIFSIGLLLAAFPFFNVEPFRWFDPANWRIMGVLQRIALAYGFGAIICYFLTERQVFTVSAILLVGYWILLNIFGGDAPYALETNAVRQLDLFLLGEAHLYKGYGMPFDPEGLLSTIPSIVSTTFGFLTGRLIQRENDRSSLMNLLFLYGSGAILLGLFWGLEFPVNKPIWSSSYVLVTTGIALMINAVLVYFIDVKGKKSWIQPFLVFGLNPLIIYVLSGVWVKIYTRIRIDEGNMYSWLYSHVFQPLAGDYPGSLLFAIFHVMGLWLIGLYLYRKKIVIKV